jgi:hypothetical protein
MGNIVGGSVLSRFFKFYFNNKTFLYNINSYIVKRGIYVKSKDDAFVKE